MTSEVWYDVYAEVGRSIGQRGIQRIYNMTDKLDALESAHAELMVEYVDLINQASKLPFLVIMNVFPPKEVLTRFVTTPRKGEFFEIFGKLSYYINLISSYITLRFFVKLFIESHIKGQANRLADSYIQLAQTISTNEPSDSRYQNWLKQAGEGTKKFANTLSSFRSISGLIGTFLPLVSSLLIAVLGITTIQQAIAELVPNPTLIVFGFLLFILAVYLFTFVMFAFIYKRNLFYPRSGSFTFDFVIELFEFFKLKEIQQHREPVHNVYQIEDKLFDLLGKKKILELPIDYIAVSIFSFVIGILYISAPCIIGTIFMFAILLMTTGFKRRWR